MGSDPEGRVEAVSVRRPGVLRYLWSLAFGWLILCSAVSSMAGPAVKRIVIIKSSSIRAYEEPIKSFISTGPKAQVKTYDLRGDMFGGMALMKRLKQSPPDLIFALGRKAAVLSASYFSKTPIIFAMVLNWQRHKLKRANTTGISLEIPGEILFTQFKLVAPKIKKIGVFYNPALSSGMIIRALRQAQRVGVTLVPVAVRKSTDLEAALTRVKNKIDALWMIPDSVVITIDNYRRMVKASWDNRWPFLAYSRNFVKAGALISVSPNYRTIGSQAGVIAKRILEDGLNPSKIKISPPIGTEVIMNEDVVHRLKLTLQPTVYTSIDKVVRDGSK